jgi:hypothetical protein
MQTIIVLSPQEGEALTAKPRLTVMLVHEDVATGLSAKATLDRVMEQLPRGFPLPTGAARQLDHLDRMPCHG